MKRFVTFVIICVLICTGAFIVKSYETKAKDQLVNDISGKIIRFHVLANSDSDIDQSLKLKVRDSVLEYISPKIKDCKSIDESRVIISKYNKEILDICNNVIRRNGYKYDVTAKISKENFPSKTYGSITLPQGEYESYRILIGSAQGRNWWCLMFPPLCFADVTKIDVNENMVEKEMKNVLNDDEYNLINDNSKRKITIKSKILEWIDDFM